MISTIKLLSTVTALGTDVAVGTDGLINVAGGVSFPARAITDVTINTSYAETAGVITITPTVSDSTTYTWYINGYSRSTGLPKTMIVSVTTAVGTSATLYGNQVRTVINADTDFSVAATGTSTIILTGKTGFPYFVVGGALASLTSVGSATATVSTGMSANNGTAGVIAQGTGALLQAKYGYSANSNALDFDNLSSMVATSYYTEVIISYLDNNIGNGVFNQTTATKQAVVLVLYGTSAQGANTFSSSTTANYSDLFGTYGTITGLAAGYAVTISAPATTTAVITTATGAIALAGGSTTFASLGSQSGDYVYIAADTTTNTGSVAKVLSLTAKDAGLTDVLTTVAGAIFKYAKWRSLPF